MRLDLLPEEAVARVLDFLPVLDLRKVRCVCKRKNGKKRKRHAAVSLSDLAHWTLEHRAREGCLTHVFVVNADKREVYVRRRISEAKANEIMYKQLRGMGYCHHIYEGEPPKPKDIDPSHWQRFNHKHKYSTAALLEHRIGMTERLARERLRTDSIFPGAQCPYNVPIPGQKRLGPMKKIRDAPDIFSVGMTRCDLCFTSRQKSNLHLVRIFQFFDAEVRELYLQALTQMLHDPNIRQYGNINTFRVVNLRVRPLCAVLNECKFNLPRITEDLFRLVFNDDFIEAIVMINPMPLLFLRQCVKFPYYFLTLCATCMKAQWRREDETSTMPLEDICLVSTPFATHMHCMYPERNSVPENGPYFANISLNDPR